MELSKKLLITAVASVMLAGCSMPGSHLSLDGKHVSKSNQEQPTLDQEVNVFPLTANNIRQFQEAKVVAQVNPKLEKELSGYQYHIGPGDILNVTIWDHPELTIPAGSYRSASEAGNWVHADGTIFYPYIGQVHVAGKTVTEVRQDIARRLAAFIEKPQVDVNVASFRSKKAYITGDVKNPGQQAITNGH